MKYRIALQTTENWQLYPVISDWTWHLVYEGEDFEDAQKHYIDSKSNERKREIGQPCRRVAVELEDRNGNWISRLDQDEINCLFDIEPNVE